MSGSPDRLYDLLPVVYRQRDADRGYPLRALLRVIAEQVEVVEQDIECLYENWFIETCEDWVVPYLGDLIGYRPVLEAGLPGDPRRPEGRALNLALSPRAAVANTLAHRSRKGTLALLELLARDVAGWPARAVESFPQLAATASLRHLRPERGRFADLRRAGSLDDLGGPFDELAHRVDVRRLGSSHSRGRFNIPAVALFIWRLRAYSVTGAPANCLERVAPHGFTFSVLGNDTPLFVRPQPEEEPTQIACRLNVPAPLRRRDLARRPGDFYGAGRSFQIWVGAKAGPRSQEIVRRPVPPERIVVADLSGWQYQPRRDTVAVDPELGRIAFPRRQAPDLGVWVTYHYGFSADLGGGEYERPLSQPAGATVYRVGEAEDLQRIWDALALWEKERPQHAVIEITDSGVYTEQLSLELGRGRSLQIRAAVGTRPVLRLLDWRTPRPDSLTVRGEGGSDLVLDGLMVTGRSVRILGGLATVTLRHCTLVPGWGLHGNCDPREPAEPSLELYDATGCIVIEHSIVGSIQVNQDEVRTDPLVIRVSDSVLDATSPEREALGAPGQLVAHVRLTVERSTVFGQVQVHAIDLAENSLFEGLIRVARRQIGCMRFCSYVPGSRTPRRFHCQPDLVEQAVEEQGGDAATRAVLRRRERDRVRPELTSVRYGTPGYCQLGDGCAPEILRGADDESEMGVFHDLFEPQRAANLRAHLDEHTPAGADAGLIFAS